jgi:hypothetical protein
MPSSAEVVRDVALCKLLARVSTPLGSAFSRLVVGAERFDSGRPGRGTQFAVVCDQRGSVNA